MRKALAAVLVFVSLAAASCRGDRTIVVHAIFDDVGDLVERASVQSSDVVVGEVASITLDGYNARVTMRINRKDRLPANAVAVVRSTSLLGEKFVDLGVPGDESPRGTLENGDTIPLSRTSRVAGLDDALLKLGQILEGGDVGELGRFVSSAAAMVRDNEEQLGELFTELKKTTSVVARHAPEIGAALDGLDAAFASLAPSSERIASAISSSGEVTEILAQQQSDLDRLLVSLDSFAKAAASYTSRTTAANDASLKSLRAILDKLMTATGDLDKALTSLARYTELWPAAAPGDYFQLDVVLENGTNQGP